MDDANTPSETAAIAETTEVAVEEPSPTAEKPSVRQTSSRPSSPAEKVSRLVYLGVGVIILWGIGVASTFPFLHKLNLNVAVLGTCIAAAALWAFLLLYRATDLREAFTAAFLVLYCGFFVASMVPGAASTLEKNGSFAHTVWDSVNAVMIAIVGFYFGGKAVEKATASAAKQR